MHEEILQIIDKLRQGTYPEADLNNILNHLFNLCQFLQELDILFQSSFINGIIFGHILIYIINIFPMQIFMH